MRNQVASRRLKRNIIFFLIILLLGLLNLRAKAQSPHKAAIRTGTAITANRLHDLHQIVFDDFTCLFQAGFSRLLRITQVGIIHATEAGDDRFLTIAYCFDILSGFPDPSHRFRLKRIFGPIMFRVANLQLLPHFKISSSPKAFQVVCHLHGLVAG